MFNVEKLEELYKRYLETTLYKKAHYVLKKEQFDSIVLKEQNKHYIQIECKWIGGGKMNNLYNSLYYDVLEDKFFQDSKWNNKIPRKIYDN